MAPLPNTAQPAVIGRQDAINAGLSRYFTGKPCKRGHIAERGANHKHCVACLREDAAAYYAENAAAHLTRTNRYRRNNPEAAAETFKRWAEKNRDKIRANVRKRRAVKSGADGFHVAADVQQIFKAQRGKCAHCKTGVRTGYHVDHIQPLSKGGSNWPRNLQVLCARCNVRKHAHDPIDFAQREGRLI